MGKNLLFQKPVVSTFGLFYIRFRLICQTSGLFFETTGFETTGFSPYKTSGETILRGQSGERGKMGNGRQGRDNRARREKWEMLLEIRFL